MLIDKNRFSNYMQLTNIDYLKMIDSSSASFRFSFIIQKRKVVGIFLSKLTSDSCITILINMSSETKLKMSLIWHDITFIVMCVLKNEF